MGQLIKLQDYTSRYEQNIFHYPTQFVKLKTQQWEKLQKKWESSLDALISQPLPLQTDESKQVPPLLNKLKILFNRKNDETEEQSFTNNQQIEELFNMEEFPPFLYLPETVEELKIYFLNHLFDFQMKWATSTLVDTSFINKKYNYDERLKYFIQRFPDTYLILYEPIFLLKKATIEVETILISPTDVWCIKFLEESDLSVFLGTNKKFWSVRNKHNEKRIVNPTIALNRTGTIVKSIFQLHDIDLPIHQILLSRNGYIDYPSAPYGLTLIDKKGYEDWFLTLRGLRSPLKAVQLKAADALLQNCLTTSIKRIEWDITDQN